MTVYADYALSRFPIKTQQHGWQQQQPQLRSDRWGDQNIPRTHPQRSPDMDVPTDTSPYLFISFRFVSIYSLCYFYKLLQPCYGAWLIAPSTNKTSAVTLLQPFDLITTMSMEALRTFSNLDNHSGVSQREACSHAFKQQKENLTCRHTAGQPLEDAEARFIWRRWC